MCVPITFVWDITFYYHCSLPFGFPKEISSWILFLLMPDNKDSNSYVGFCSKGTINTLYPVFKDIFWAIPLGILIPKSLSHFCITASIATSKQNFTCKLIYKMSERLFMAFRWGVAGWILIFYLSIVSILKKNWYLVEEMTEKLKELKPYKVILFGSYANGNPTEDSDLDVLVVLDSEEISKNLDEKIKRDMPVSRMLISINRKIAMDLITYSKAEYEYLIEQNDFFVKEITNTGSILYER